MSASETLTCAANVTDETLTAWHDGFLTGEASTALAAHVPACPACQSRLAILARVDALVGAERMPQGGDRLWRDIQHGLARAPATKFTGSWSREAWRSAAVALSALLIVVSFVGVFYASRHSPAAQHTPTAAVPASPTASPALTPLPAVLLAWHPATTPVTLTREISPPQFAVAPSDGNTAYVCSTSPVQPYGPPQLWVTHDRAAHWAEVDSFTALLPRQATIASCQLAVDQNNAATLAVTLDTDGNPTTISPTFIFISTNGGSAWRETRLSVPAELDTLASAGGAAYAVFIPWLLRDPLPSRFWRSTDGMRTWSPVTSRRELGDLGVAQQFWLQPDTGSLLIQLGGSLYTSSDGGNTWSLLSAKSSNSSSSDTTTSNSLLVGQPQQGVPWHICAGTGDTPSSGSPTAFAWQCTVDGGSTWQAIPSGQTEPIAIASDGSLIGELHTPAVVSGVPQPALFRLRSGSGQWQSLGVAPEFRVLYALGPSSGVLWAVPETGVVIDTQQRIFTADYVP
jgi:hypothetical protein